MTEHHTDVLVTKAQEAALHTDGVFTRAKPLGPVLSETLERVKHPFT